LGYHGITDPPEGRDHLPAPALILCKLCMKSTYMPLSIKIYYITGTEDDQAMLEILRMAMDALLSDG